MTASYEAYGASHIGKVRHRNEDSYAVDLNLGAYVVADGIGSLSEGHVASRLAVTTLLSAIKLKKAETSLDGRSSLLEESILAAHAAIRTVNQSLSSAQSMGTTLSALIIFDEDFVFGNVGDTKAFCFSRQFGHVKAMQLSQDHTVASELIRRGAPPHLIFNPGTRALTQAIGITGLLRPAIVEGKLEIGDCVVICSDGVSDYVPRNDFEVLLARHIDQPQALVTGLIDSALRNEGGDNCTCISVLRTG